MLNNFKTNKFIDCHKHKKLWNFAQRIISICVNKKKLEIISL